MSRAENEQRIKSLFSREQTVFFAKQFVDDPEAVADEALQIFDGMLPEMAYVDDPDSEMAQALFGCCGALSIYLALRRRDVDVHEFGGAFLEGTRANLRSAPRSTIQGPSDRERISHLIENSVTSRTAPRPGEFVFEAFMGDGTDFDWGMNVKSCAICHAFSKYDAIELVPYMCATDDIVSDFGNQGLRRTGTIALGAHQCDFRYKSGGEPLRIVEQYADRIHDSKSE